MPWLSGYDYFNSVNASSSAPLAMMNVTPAQNMTNTTRCARFSDRIHSCCRLMSSAKPCCSAHLS